MYPCPNHIHHTIGSSTHGIPHRRTTAQSDNQWQQHRNQTHAQGNLLRFTPVVLGQLGKLPGVYLLFPLKRDGDGLGGQW